MKNNLGSGISSLISTPKKQDDKPSKQQVSKKTSTHVNKSTVIDTVKNVEEVRKRFTTYVDPSLVKEIKVYCAQEEMNIQDFVDDALRKYLGKVVREG